MENDSLSMLNPAAIVNDVDSVESADSLVATENLDEIPMPSPEQLGIHITSGMKDAAGIVQPLAVTVGDTFEFPVTISWNVNSSVLLIMPMSSATAKGLDQVSVSQESARMVKDGQEMASITFTYKIVAQDTGDLNVPAMRFEIPTQLGRPLDLRSDSVPVRVNPPVSVVPFVVGAVVAICVIVAGLLRMKRRAAAKAATAAKNAAAEELREQMLVLKRRINTADCREWLLDLEKVCKAYAAERFALDADKVKLEELLKNGDLEGWETLVEKFADARYSGGKRDAFENRETWKGAMKLMGIEEE
ncbi:MAG: BatD family protein [Fibrobacter sp.]|nr:BatD family protein [Fibrobacter sp.]